jgi:hypothetical protein
MSVSLYEITKKERAQAHEKGIQEAAFLEARLGVDQNGNPRDSVRTVAVGTATGRCRSAWLPFASAGIARLMVGKRPSAASSVGGVCG